jgi:parallel beta-helix repeat protein
VFGSWSGGCSGGGACSLSFSTPTATASFSCFAGQTAFVDHTNGVDDDSHGFGSGVCAYKTLSYALTHTGGDISLLGSDTFPGGVFGEAFSYTLTQGQTLTCNGATFSPDPRNGSVADFVQIFGTTNVLRGCTIDGGNLYSRCVHVTNSGFSSSNGNVITNNTLQNCLYGIQVDRQMGNLSITSNTFNAGSPTFAEIDFLGSNSATLTSNTLSNTSQASIFCENSDTEPNVTGSKNTFPSCLGCQRCPLF